MNIEQRENAKHFLSIELEKSTIFLTEHLVYLIKQKNYVKIYI